MRRALWAWCFLWSLILTVSASARAEDFLLVPVCVIPEGVPEDVARNGWIFGPNASTVIRMRREEFAKRARGQMVYVYNPGAPPENTKKLPIAYHHLPCTKDPSPPAPPAAPSTAAGPPPAPPPPATGGASGDAPKATRKPAASEESEAPPDLPQPIVYPKDDAEPRPRLPPRGVTTHWPKAVLPFKRTQVDTHTRVLPSTPLLPFKETQVDTHTRVLPSTHVLPFAHEVKKPGPDGKGEGGNSDAPVKVAQKSALDKFSEEMAYAGALANVNLNHDTKRPDGKQYGIPGGKNATGPNNPIAQAAAGAIGVVAAVLSAGAGGFRKKLVDALKKGEPIAYKEVAELGEKAAEELAKKYGYKITHALHVNGTIGPYSVMRKFTDNLGGRYQAHHILEVNMMERFRMGKSDLGPAVILTEAEHKAISARLKVATTDAKTPQHLWKAYQKAYAEHPHWLKAIESYFTKGK